MHKFLALYEGQTVATVELIGITGNESLVKQVIEHLKEQHDRKAAPDQTRNSEGDPLPGPGLRLIPRDDVEVQQL